MSSSESEVVRGQKLYGSGGRRIGTVDAVFADYLLVRTSGLPPVDLYVPRTELTTDDAGRITVQVGRADAYEAWHRPMKKVEHA